MYKHMAFFVTKSIDTWVKCTDTWLECVVTWLEWIDTWFQCIDTWFLCIDTWYQCIDTRFQCIVTWFQCMTWMCRLIAFLLTFMTRMFRQVWHECSDTWFQYIDTLPSKNTSSDSSRRLEMLARIGFRGSEFGSSDVTGNVAGWKVKKVWATH